MKAPARTDRDRDVRPGQIWQAIEPYRYRHNKLTVQRFVVVLRVEMDADPKNGGFVFVRNIGPATGVCYGRTNRIYTGNLDRCYTYVRAQWEPGQHFEEDGKP